MSKKTNPEATVIANKILLTYEKLTLAAELDLSRPTLDSRLANHQWGKLEVRELNRIHDRITKRV